MAATEIANRTSEARAYRGRSDTARADRSRRAELGGFLKTRRARLRPEDTAQVAAALTP